MGSRGIVSLDFKFLMVWIWEVSVDARGPKVVGTELKDSIRLSQRSLFVKQTKLILFDRSQKKYTLGL